MDTLLQAERYVQSGTGHTGNDGQRRVSESGAPGGIDLIERKFVLLPGIVQVTLDHGEQPDRIVPLLTEAAILARARKMRQLLVVSGEGDPATPEAVSLALDTMHALGAPPPLKIAFVACTLPQYSVYHFSESYAPRFGIAARVFTSLRDAQDWLTLREGAGTQPQGSARRDLPARVQRGVQSDSAARPAAGGPILSSPLHSIRSTGPRARGDQ